MKAIAPRIGGIPSDQPGSRAAAPLIVIAAVCSMAAACYLIVAGALEYLAMKEWSLAAALSPALTFLFLGVALRAAYVYHRRALSHARALAQSKAEAEQTNREFQRFVAMSPDLILVQDLDGRLRRVSPASSALLGRAPETLIGTRLVTLIHPEDLRAQGDMLAFLRDSGGAVTGLSSRVRHADGRWIEIEWSITVFEDTGTVCAVGRDVTERRRGQRALEQARDDAEAAGARVRKIIDISQDLIATCDTDGIFRSMSPACRQVLGCEPEQIVGRRYLDLVHPDDLAGTSMISFAMAQGGAATGTLRRMRHRLGHWVPLEWNITYVQQDRLVYLIGRDITERVRTEAELARTRDDAVAAREQLQRVIDLSLDMIVTLDAGGVISSASPASRIVTGYEPDELIGRRLIDLAHPEDLQATSVAAFVRERGGSVRSAERRLRHKEGHWAWLEWSLTLLPGENLVYGIARNVTQRKQREEELEAARRKAEQAVAVKSQFLANMSHEIRTPMNGVIGMLGFLQETQLNGEQASYAETALHSAEALLSVINDILDFSKIESGKLDIERVPFDLAALIEEVTALLGERAHAKGLELGGWLDPDVPEWVAGDPTRLRQILMNLVGNAVKFTAHGEISLHVSMEEPGGGELGIRCAVTDTGIGIPEQAQARIFEPFAQADGSTTRRFGGTGLGLSVCRQLAELMGGTIGVDSAPGQGSTFWVTLPFGRTRQPAGPRPPLPFRGVRVLVVDDHPVNRTVATGLLGRWGMLCAEAETGPEALERLRRAAAAGEPYDLLMLDVMMPRMDGFEVARRVGADPRLRVTPVVLLSSLGQTIDITSLGVAAALTKPLRRETLFATLSDLLERAPAPQTATEHTAVASGTSPAQMRDADCRVLIVEDNAVNQQVALKMLQREGVAAHLAEDGAEALRLLAAHSYELVLMDCQMPVMDGFEATARIRERERSGGRRTAIVAMTANAMEGDRDACIEAGMDDYLAKPLTRAQVSAVLDRWLPGGDQ